MFNKIMSFLGTIHPVLHLLNKCAQNNNTQPQNYTMSIFCDRSKAFDVTNHNILILKKVDHYGVRGIAKNWLINYLTNITQFVEIKSTKSQITNHKYRVRRPPRINPRTASLFYVNDIAKSTTGNILSFADHTSLYLSNPKIGNQHEMANI